MNTQTMEPMLRALKPVINNPAKARRLLERFWQDKIALVWTTQQLHRAANEKKTVLTENEARRILQELGKQHNPQYGLQWSDLKEAVVNSGLGRDITRAELKRFIYQDRLAIELKTQTKKGRKSKCSQGQL